jgi:hypothetical protein
VLIILVLIHGLIHVMGFVKAYNLAEMKQLTKPISRPNGILWLMTACLFLLAAACLFFKLQLWWIPASLAILFSQLMIIISWKDAKFGTIANLLIIIPVIVSFANSLPSSYYNQFRKEVNSRIVAGSNISIIEKKDISHLPSIIQKYLLYTGSVGKPRVINFGGEFKGQMRRSLDAKWTKIVAAQYNFYDDPARLFYVKSRLYGIPFDGYHHYTDSSAVMQIKVAHLFQVVDAKGEKMNQSENVTLFNDMCVLAPATLIDTNIRWEAVDSLTVKAYFTHNHITASAILYFNEKGELINFVSDDRYLSEDGKEYKSYRWSTPVKNYQDFDGRKVATSGEAIWTLPEGEFCYAKFQIEKLRYNLVDKKK